MMECFASYETIPFTKARARKRLLGAFLASNLANFLEGDSCGACLKLIKNTLSIRRLIFNKLDKQLHNFKFPDDCTEVPC